MKTGAGFLAASLALLTLSGIAEVKIEETIVAPPWEVGTILTLSPGGMHLASTHAKGSRFVVTVDGVDGEPCDEVYNAGIGFEQKISDDGFFMRSSTTWTAPVVFSPDGTRHAYAARTGKEVFVMLDGTEVFRAPVVMGKSPANNLFFSPDGKHLFFLSQTDDSQQSYRLMMDGKPVTPPFETVQFPTFSPDGSRWALVGIKPRQSNPSILVIDGKDPGYFGERVQFTPDNKRVVCVAGAAPRQSLLVDGKPLVSGPGLVKYGISSKGDIGAIVALEPGRWQFFINGKLTLDTTSDFVFSPDGKRWAATQGVNREISVVVDGVKGTVVGPGALNLQFSPDSTRYSYVVERGLEYHVVIDGKESEGFRVLDRRPQFGQTGHGFIYVGGFQIGQMRVYFNDHVEPMEQRPRPFISPDGKRYVYHGKGGTGDPIFDRWIVDGVVKLDARPGGAMEAPFSPDSKHLVLTVNQALWFDDQIVKILHTPVGFTKDSRNLILKGRETGANGQLNDVYFLNGDAVARLATKGMQYSGTRPKEWEEQPDGRLVFVGNSGGGPNGYGPIKRITVTPDPAGSATAWVAQVAAAEAQAIAEAEAAKKKAADDAAAAAAKKKADYDAAVAAKAKARQDALDAKKKAQADAAAKKKK